MKNNKIILKNKEEFLGSSRRKDIIDKFLDQLPFFISWSLKLYYNIFKEGFKNPVYWVALFTWFVIMKKIVRVNLEDTYKYSYNN
tara:strand:- start:60 stop:314 length:255 start_codon:yes stop_codon:yes gene_type:complete